MKGVDIRKVECLPNGVVILVADCNSYSFFDKLPGFVRFKGNAYGKAGWNSDRGVAYFRSDISYK